MKFKNKIDFSELGLIEIEEDLEQAITEQLKAHGMTDEEIKQWFEEADKEEESSSIIKR
jgi:hypothetical protein